MKIGDCITVSETYTRVWLDDEDRVLWAVNFMKKNRTGVFIGPATIEDRNGKIDVGVIQFDPGENPAYFPLDSIVGNGH